MSEEKTPEEKANLKRWADLTASWPAARAAGEGKPVEITHALAPAQAQRSAGMWARFTIPESGTPVPPTQASPAPQPAAPGGLGGLGGPATFIEKDVYGIWDGVWDGGKQAELSFDSNRNFCLVLPDFSYGFWGSWTLGPNPGKHPIIFTSRRGNFPARFYGPQGAVDLVYAENEHWEILSASQDTVQLVGMSMKRRNANVGIAASRISEVQTTLKLAESSAMQTAANARTQRDAIRSMQQAMGDYINRGSGRY